MVIAENGVELKRFIKRGLTMYEIIQVIVLIVGIISAWVITQEQVKEIRAWGEPPAGRMYILEQDVKRHHEVTTGEQTIQQKADHDALIRLEGEIKRLSDAVERQNKLQDQLLTMMKSR